MRRFSFVDEQVAKNKTTSFAWKAKILPLNYVGISAALTPLPRHHFKRFSVDFR